MGKEATEIGYDEGSLIALVASTPKSGLLVAGLNDGRVWLADPAGQGLNFLKADKGASIVALAMSPDAKHVAWADEDGHAGVFAV
jgi:hypothetical protein